MITLAYDKPQIYKNSCSFIIFSLAPSQAVIIIIIIILNVVRSRGREEEEGNKNTPT